MTKKRKEPEEYMVVAPIVGWQCFKLKARSKAEARRKVNRWLEAIGYYSQEIEDPFLYVNTDNLEEDLKEIEVRGGELSGVRGTWEVVLRDEF
jgi:hypothetical protein